MKSLLAASNLPVNLNEKQYFFAMWLATPKKDRQPNTQKLLAKDLQVDEDTLTNWKSIPGFTNAVIELTKETVKRRVPEVLHRMTDDALQPGAKQDVTDRVLELAGVWSKKQTIEHQFVFEDMLNEIIEGEEVSS